MNSGLNGAHVSTRAALNHNHITQLHISTRGVRLSCKYNRELMTYVGWVEGGQVPIDSFTSIRFIDLPRSWDT